MINTQYATTQGLQFWKDAIWDDLQYHKESQDHKDFLLEVLAPLSLYIYKNKCIGRYGTHKLAKIIHSRLVSVVNYFANNSKNITAQQKQNLLEVFYWYAFFQKVIFLSDNNLKELTSLQEVYSHLKISLVAAEMSTNGKDKKSFYDLVRRAANRYERGELPRERILTLHAKDLLNATEKHLREKVKAQEESKTIKDVIVNFFTSPAFVRIGIIRAFTEPAPNIKASSVDIMISNVSLKNVLENKPVGYLAPTPRNNKATAVLGLYLKESTIEAQHLMAMEKMQIAEEQKRVAYLLSQMSAEDRDLLEKYFKNKLY